MAWDEQPDGQPNMTLDEFKECDATLRRDPWVIEALAGRGITDMDRVLIDTWAYGAHLLPEDHEEGRLGWADVWHRASDGGSPYANPVTGLHLIVDLNRMELLEIEDAQTVEPPHTMGEYVPHLVPGGAFPPMFHPDSPVLRRARAIEHTLWVTPYHEDERWPCGEFVVQSAEDRGLPVWTAQDRNIEGTDVVLWYVFGIHHVTRPEEWPVMSVDKVSFWLKPTGFFDRNPALDVPPSPRHCHTEETG